MTDAQTPGINEIVQMAHFLLREDLGPDMAKGDITSNAVIPADAKVTAVMRAREDMVLAGAGMAAIIFGTLDASLTVSDIPAEGAPLKSGETIMTISGNARAVLAGERTALNLVQHLSGIATLTRQYVDAIEGTGAVLLDTRKTSPGMRRLEKYATHLGGATNHRMGLYDAIMIKDNHLAIVGSLAQAVADAHAAGHENVEVECDTLEQVKEALGVGVSRILLDNMSPAQLAEAVKLRADKNPKCELEASGGIALEIIADVAKTGVDFISVGRITQSAPAVDIGLDYQE